MAVWTQVFQLVRHSKGIFTLWGSYLELSSFSYCYLLLGGSCFNINVLLHSCFWLNHETPYHHIEETSIQVAPARYVP